MKTLRHFALVCAGLIALAGCAYRYDDADGYDVQNYPYAEGTTLEEIYRPEPLPRAFGTCAAELAELNRQGYEQNVSRSTREVQVRVLSFSEVYDNQRIHAALTDTLYFTTRIPGERIRGTNMRQRDRRIFVRVPKGFVTDFTSVPPGFAQSFHRTFGRTAIPAIVHDFLYAVGEPGDEEGRKFADAILRRGMKDNGSRLISRHTVYRVVRFGGRKSYGAARELRFLDAKRDPPVRYHDPNNIDTRRLVVPISEFRRDASGRRISAAEELRRRYVLVCELERPAP